MKPETKERITLVWMWAVAVITTVAMALTAIAWIIGLVFYAFKLIRRIYG